ncbi:hypothetical protein ACFL2Q_12190 [Thermodesulfobacteriota bacterium]
MNLTETESSVFGKNLNRALKKVTLRGGMVLYPPYVVVCHDTRYYHNSYTGLTRILGLGKFGEFATFTLEELSRTLLAEFKRKGYEFKPEDVVAEYDGVKIVPILRVYAPTNPGKRSQRYSLHVVSPSDDLGLDVSEIEGEAKSRYHIS